MRKPGWETVCRKSSRCRKQRCSLLLFFACAAWYADALSVSTSGLNAAEQVCVADAMLAATGFQWRVTDTNPTGRRAALLHDLAEEQDHQQLIDEVAALLDAASVQSPLLLSLAPAALDGEDPASVAAAVEEAYLLHVAEYGLCDPVETHHISWTAECAAPVSNVLLDAAHDGASGRWDVSRVVALDGVVDEALRRRLLSLLGDGDDWEPARGPDRRVWHDRAFSDTTQHGASHSGASWGLSGERIRALCQTANEGGAPPEAIVELQSRLCELLRHFNAVNVTVCRMPNAVFGEEVPPIAANAPVFADGDCYGWHIDADPLLVPPSPWTDAFGRYPNRSPAKPRFVSALVYLSPEWRPEWGAPTRFLDLPTSKVLEIAPTPGRLVLLDQDVSHAVTAPTAEAGGRPRYSLVLKLVLHATENAGQPSGGSEAQEQLVVRISSPSWPEEKMGSALQVPDNEVIG